MKESISLFEAICNSLFLKKGPIILFFTHVELFREKISSQAQPLKQYFSDYYGSPTNVRAAGEFLAAKFKSCARDYGEDVYIHFIYGICTDIWPRIMDSIHDHIVEQDLRDLNLV